MSAAESHAAPYIEAQQAQASALPAVGVAALDHSRSEALQLLGERGLPTQRDEDWKYTSIKAITRTRFTPAAPSVECSKEMVDASAIENLDSWRLVFADGFYQPEHSTLDGLPEGIRLAGLGEILKTDPDSVTKHIGSAMGEMPHGFAAMNSAFVGDGALIEIGILGTRLCI